MTIAPNQVAATAHPSPGAPRRRRRRWMVRLGVVALILALYLLSFPGAHQPLPNTPYTLVVQPGSGAATVALATRGLTLADGYLADSGLMTATRPVTVRLARWSPCSPLNPILALAPTAIADADQICVNTVSGVWQQGLNETPGIAIAVMAHEHYHTVQGQQGCLPPPGDRRYAWITEGSATYIGWETAIHAGLLDRAWVDDLIADILAGTTTAEPLSTYETHADGDAIYMRSYQAIGQLVAGAGSVRSLEQFCTQIGAGMEWHQAFATAFGLSVETFYQQELTGRSGPATAPPAITRPVRPYAPSSWVLLLAR
jgi:hypothetical protein